MAETFEAPAVSTQEQKLRDIFARRDADGRVTCNVQTAGEAVEPPAGWKRVSFVRHGEGHHNVAQREWHEAGKPGEPYTLETDPEYKYLDPLLTEKGEQQARELQERAAALGAEVVLTSPLRRATQTALIAFEKVPGAPVLAHELLHELAGKHTCDKRHGIRELSTSFPQVDYSQLVCEEDPYWGDGRTRETWEILADRGAAFAKWLLERPERRIVVAGHSAWLQTFFNAVVRMEQPAGDEAGLRTWFSTGEMRTVLLGPEVTPEEEEEGDEDEAGEEDEEERAARAAEKEAARKEKAERRAAKTAAAMQAAAEKAAAKKAKVAEKAAAKKVKAKEKKEANRARLIGRKADIAERKAELKEKLAERKEKIAKRKAALKAKAAAKKAAAKFKKMKAKLKIASKKRPSAAASLKKRLVKKGALKKSLKKRLVKKGALKKRPAGRKVAVAAKKRPAARK